MSSVLALKRSNSTVRYCFEADAEPGVLPRALELLAKRGLVPARVFAQAADDQLSVEIEVEGLSPDTAEHVGRCLGQAAGINLCYQRPRRPPQRQQPGPGPAATAAGVFRNLCGRGGRWRVPRTPGHRAGAPGR